MIRGSSFIPLIVETTCSTLILDQSGSPQAQAQAGLICSITVIINTRTRTLTIFVIAPPTLGVCLLGWRWCPSESWPKPMNRCGFAQESVLDPRGGSLLVNRLPLLGDACKLMCKADRCVKKPSLERPCGCSEEGFASTHRESEKGSSRQLRGTEAVRPIGFCVADCLG